MQSQQTRAASVTIAIYIVAGAVAVLAASYASVPLYRLYCQSTGSGGHAIATTLNYEDMLVPVDSPPITIQFTSNVGRGLQWSFVPAQKSVKVVPGEAALAFYTVTNKSKRDITGVATYSVQPPRAGAFFHKIQCFCFEEQRLNAGETVDMPVFFFIDPEILKDRTLRHVRNIVLAYTFFESNDQSLPEIQKASEALSAAADGRAAAAIGS